MGDLEQLHQLEEAKQKAKEVSEEAYKAFNVE